MNGMSEEPLAPQNFLYGCVLEAGKEVVFNPEDDEFEHQLDLRMACVDPATKDELHMVEVEGTDTEGQTVKAALVSLKPSTLPSVCLGGFTITPPAVFRLKAGSGPIHISGQHLVMMENDETFDEEEEEEEEEEVVTSKKRVASSPAAKNQKKMKMEVEEEDDDEDDDEDEDDDDDEEDDEESEAEESPVKAKPTPAKKKTPAQNGKTSTPSTPASKEKQKTPKGKGDKSPKSPLTIPEVKTKIMESINKGVLMPKVQAKFENYIKNCHRLADPKDIAELWTWRQTLKDAK
ncbi:nucleophosmin 1a [Salarias fasciatus]|uniref:Nucleophosmin-like n=1 Tax=Salarias fasciatus TaxID=181472 RepID=A0A672IFW2_SALFA|nr:nucleophosmin-like [Salarias fasciatus]